MQRTFNDLYREQRLKAGWFGFVLWTFIETAMGIIKEYILLIIKDAQ